MVYEDEDAVEVRVILCYEEPDDEPVDNEFTDCPVHVYLEKPLNGRRVVEVQSAQDLPLFVPRWAEASDPAQASATIDDSAD
jgi:hypothetical protein